MKQGRLNTALYWLGGFIVLIGAALFGMLWWNYMFHTPCRMEVDCRGKGIETKIMRQWEIREEEGDSYLGILKMAGWRVDEEQTVCSVSTGRKRVAKVLSIYGSMELVEETDILCGRYGLDVEGRFCVLSKGLAGHLFGCTEVAGECIKMERDRFIVAGVVDIEEDFLMIPMNEGRIDHLAVMFENREGAGEKLQRLIGGGRQ